MRHVTRMLGQQPRGPVREPKLLGRRHEPGALTVWHRNRPGLDAGYQDLPVRFAAVQHVRLVVRACSTCPQHPTSKEPTSRTTNARPPTRRPSRRCRGPVRRPGARRRRHTTAPRSPGGGPIPGCSWAMVVSLDSGTAPHRSALAGAGHRRVSSAADTNPTSGCTPWRGASVTGPLRWQMSCHQFASRAWNAEPPSVTSLARGATTP